jgi:hypothetical protein
LWHDENDAQHLHNYRRIPGPPNQWYEARGVFDVPGYHLTGLHVASEGWDYDVYIDYIKVVPVISPGPPGTGEDETDFDFNVLGGRPDIDQPGGQLLLYDLPNPFDATSSIAFDLASASHVQARLYSVEGQLVSTLANEPLPAGRHVLQWDGKDDRGGRAASGVYFLRMRAGHCEVQRKLIRSE